MLSVRFVEVDQESDPAVGEHQVGLELLLEHGSSTTSYTDSKSPRALCAVNAHVRINDAARDPIDGVHFAALSASPRAPREMMHERPGNGIHGCRRA
jgi:hypothetical protein